MNVIISSTTKFISNIFLLIISLLKILSSNYILLLIFNLIIFYIIYFLSRRKIVLSCSNCDNGSWWYKCKKNTGFCSNTCNNYISIINKTQDLYNYILLLHTKIKDITILFIQHTSELMIKWTTFYTSYILLILKLHPTYIISNFLLKPIVPLIDNIFKNLINNLKKLNMGFIIPLINIDINIGKLIKIPLINTIKLVYLLFTTFLSLFKSISTLIYKLILKPLLTSIKNIIQNTILIIKKNMDKIFKDFNKLYSLIYNGSLNIKKIKTIHIIFLIIDTYIKYITSFLSNYPFILNNSSLILYITFYILILTLIIPILGCILSFFSLIKSIIFMILGCDDNNDFRILFINFFNIFFNFK